MQKRIAAAMAPDTAADAPIMGATWCWWVKRWASSACDCRDGEEREKSHWPEATGDRTAERQHPQHVERDVGDVSVQERICQECPDLRADAPGNCPASTDVS